MTVIHTTREEEPPMNINCEYQVRINSGEYKCMTEEQYQTYTFEKAHSDKVSNYVLLGCLIFAAGIAYLFYKLTE